MLRHSSWCRVCMCLTTLFLMALDLSSLWSFLMSICRTLVLPTQPPLLPSPRNSSLAGLVGFSEYSRVVFNRHEKKLCSRLRSDTLGSLFLPVIFRVNPQSTLSFACSYLKGNKNISLKKNHNDYPSDNEQSFTHHQMDNRSVRSF